MSSREPEPISALESSLLTLSVLHGFPLSGVVDIDRVDLSEHVSRYDDWIAADRAGAMQYLKRGRDRRADPRLVLPGAEAVFCVAVPYPRGAAGSVDPARGVRYARYLQGPDYHEEMRERLERLMLEVKASHPELQYKVCVDTSAVLERSWAAACGLGWIGKNTLLINPKLGSYLFLGEVILTLKTGAVPKFQPNYCGHCTACLDICPTQALPQAGVLDSRNCIAYLTLEHRGPHAISDITVKKIGNWVAGCDLCQEVCPFNRKPVRDEKPVEASFFAKDPTLLTDWQAVLSETKAEYQERILGTALERIKPKDWDRNLAIALQNTLGGLDSSEREQLLKQLAPAILARKTSWGEDQEAKDRWSHFLKV